VAGFAVSEDQVARFLQQKATQLDVAADPLAKALKLKRWGWGPGKVMVMVN